MLLPAKYDLIFWTGNDLEFQFRAKQESGDPFDLTGSELVMTITHGQSQKISIQTGTPNLVITDAANGLFAVKISRDVTRQIRPRYPNVIYEIERRIDGIETTIINGNIVLLGGNNKDAA